MSLAHQSALDAARAALDALAADITGGLRHADGAFSLCASAEALAETPDVLGAVRGLGADALAPFLLTGRPLTGLDAALLRAAAAAHPAPAADEPHGALWQARDAALAAALAALGTGTAGWEGLAPAPPAPARPGAAPHWAAWSASLAPLSSLALPPVASSQRATARERRLDVARGLVRALLRRDQLTAARHARWLALDAPPKPEPWLATALDHIAALAPDRPRVLMETGIARLLLGPATADDPPVTRG